MTETEMLRAPTRLPPSCKPDMLGGIEGAAMRELEEAASALAAARATSDPDEKVRRAEAALGMLESVLAALSPTMSWQARRVLDYFAKLNLNPGSRATSLRYIETMATSDGISGADVDKGFADLVGKGCLIDTGGGQYVLTDAGYQHIA